MMKNKLVDSRRLSSEFMLFVVSCLIVLGILMLPRNSDWLRDTVQRFYSQRQKLGSKTDRQTRERAGYGKAYDYVTLIRKNCTPTDYFLIPPQRYLIRKAYRQGAADGYAWLYPSVLYYHLGRSVRLIDMTDADTLLKKATYTFWVAGGKINLCPLTSQNRTDVLTEFRRYDPHFFAYTPEQARAYYQSGQ